MRGKHWALSPSTSDLSQPLFALILHLHLTPASTLQSHSPSFSFSNLPHSLLLLSFYILLPGILFWITPTHLSYAYQNSDEISLPQNPMLVISLVPVYGKIFMIKLAKIVSYSNNDIIKIDQKMDRTIHMHVYININLSSDFNIIAGSAFFGNTFYFYILRFCLSCFFILKYILC